MDRRHFLRSVAAAGAASLAARAGAATRAPNIILILTDDMGWGDVGCYGGRFAPTPNLDQLAAEGTRYQQYYSASPICSPSRTGLTTGMYPGRWRITSYLQTRAGNAACGQADYLDPAAPSLARALKAAGYATAHFGKWHMGGGRDVRDAPKFAAYGFDENASTWESPEPHPDITSTDWIWAPSDKVKRYDRTGFFVDKTLDFLKRHPDQPCYVNLWPDDTHTPFVPSDDRLASYPEGPPEQRRFAAVLDEYDRQIGRLLTGLRALGQEQNTLLLFTSDNGALPTFGGRRSAGLRGSKLGLYEGGIRMPFVARWPGHVPAGRVDDASVLHAVDLFPTLCAVAGASLPATARLDGRDQSTVLLGGGQTGERTLYFEYGRNATAFAYPQGRDRSPVLAVRQGKWKLLCNADGGGAELYDLAADRNETTDVAAKEQAVTGRLRDLVTAWRRELP
ncbi:MAG: sulfatase-like hydrolase/transferase [Armatimonadetes bacterium]|nr:sulfatase-like hydrolase/transferase [Armatimonadota bacterium]